MIRAPQCFKSGLLAFQSSPFSPFQSIPTRPVLMWGSQCNSMQDRIVKSIEYTYCLCCPVAVSGSRFGREDGISTLTFEHSIAYIHMCSPKCFILEMVWKHKIREQFMASIQKHCPNYAFWSGIINSAVISPSSRPRFYIVAVDTLQVAFDRGLEPRITQVL